MTPAWENRNTRRKPRTIATFSTAGVTWSGCDPTQESAMSPETNGVTPLQTRNPLKMKRRLLYLKTQFVAQ